MRFLGNHTKCFNSLRNRARKLIFGQNVHSYKATKVTRAIFDILQISIMAAIFRPKTAIFMQKWPPLWKFAKYQKSLL